MASTFVPYRHPINYGAANALNDAIRAEAEVAAWTEEIRFCRSADQRHFVNAHIRHAKERMDAAMELAMKLDN